MLKKSLFTLLAVGTMSAFAAGNSFKVHFFQDSTVNGKTIKAGDYKVEVANGTATMKEGKQVVEVPVHVVTAPNRYNTTESVYKDNSELQEIHVGGTQTKLVFDESGNPTGTK